MCFGYFLSTVVYIDCNCVTIVHSDCGLFYLPNYIARLFIYIYCLVMRYLVMSVCKYNEYELHEFKEVIGTKVKYSMIFTGNSF